MRHVYFAFALVLLWQVAAGLTVAHYGAEYINEIFAPVVQALR